MTSHLAGVRAKLGHARIHLDELEHTVAMAGTLMAAAIDVRRTLDLRRFELWSGPHTIVDPAWSALMGDCLFAWRSALDHLAYQLVLVSGGTPTRSTAFPIALKELDTRGVVASAASILACVRRSSAVVEEHQPYTRNRPTWHQLAVLQELNNIDKHRTLLVAVTAVNVADASWGIPAGSPSPKVWFNEEPINPDQLIATFEFAEAHLACFRPYVPLGIRFAEGPEWILLGDVMRVFRMLRYYVEGWRIPHFKPFLA